MKRFHPALVALTIIGSTVMATATRAETQDTGYQGNAQYARPYHDQYARPYHYRYARASKWPRLSEQDFRFDRWRICRG